MIRLRSIKKYAQILLLLLTAIFLIVGFFIVKRGSRDFHRENATSLTYIAASLEDYLSYGDSLSVDLNAQPDLRVIGRKDMLQGEDIICLTNLATRLRLTSDVNNVVSSIYVYLARSQKVLTKETLYQFEEFYDYEMIRRYLDGVDFVSYTCRASDSRNLSYINSSKVLSIARRYPFSSPFPEIAVVVNLDINRILFGFSHYERIYLVYGDNVVGGSDIATEKVDTLLSEAEFSGERGFIYLSRTRDYCYYQKLAKTDIYSTILVNRSQLLEAYLPNLSILILLYGIALMTVCALQFVFSKAIASRSQRLSAQIDEIADSAPYTEAGDLQTLDDAIDRLVSNNREMAENEKKYIFLLQNVMISDIILGNISVEDLSERLAMSRLTFDAPYFTGLVCVPDLMDSDLLVNAFSGSIILLIKELIDRELCKSLQVFSALSPDNKIFFFINHEQAEANLNASLRALLHKIAIQAQNDYDIPLFFAIGSCVTALSDVAKSCYVANKLIDNAYHPGISDNVISNDEFEEALPDFPVNVSTRILHGFKKLSRESIKAGADEFFDKYLIPGGFMPAMCRNITAIMVANIVSELWRNNWSVSIGDMPNYMSVISKAKTVNELRSNFDTLMDVLLDTQPSHTLSENEYTEKYISTVIEYINNEYAHDLTIADISASVNLNPRYLGELFKEATGKTLVKYLNTVRIEHACTLLVDSVDTVKDIATQIGYNDVHAFIRHFKSMNAGMTPSEYREAHK